MSMMRVDFSLRVKAFIALFLIAAIVIIVLQIFLHHEISPSQSSTIKFAVDVPRYRNDAFQSNKASDFNIDILKEEISGLKHDIMELKNIKSAALNELQSLNKKHHLSTSEIKMISTEKIKASNDLQKLRKELIKIKKELGSLQSTFAVKKMQLNIPIAAPIKPNDVGKTTHLKSITRNLTRFGCTFSSCFDHSFCPILSKFMVYVHQPSRIKNLPLDMEKSNLIYNEIVKMPFSVGNPKVACLFVVILVIDYAKHRNKENQVLKYLKSLKTWKNDGQNHLLLLLSNNKSIQLSCGYFEKLSRLQASVVSSTLCRKFYRDHFDFLLFPSKLESTNEETWNYLPSLVPIKRSYLFSFFDHFSESQISQRDFISLKGGMDDVYIHTKSQCNKTTDCKNRNLFEKILKNSIFNLLFNIKNYSKLTDGMITSFKHGTIPVMIGDQLPLPFSHVIDYRKAILMIPLARITETHFILRTMNKIDIFTMKKKGRFIFETYFSSLSKQLKTMFAVFQHNIKLPPTPMPDYIAKPLYKSMIVGRISNSDVGILKSALFNQNWTSTNVNSYDHWNNFPGGHYLLPFIPTNAALPSSVQFAEDSNEYMPIGNGQANDGNNFANSLGGDKSTEHFTIIILTYNREMILMESLQRLAGLKYLNRVLVIWNNPARPSDELDWPDIGVPIHVIKAEKNSLNNRFLPYDLIDTEAVLSMDDDIYLRYDEIELAFRVWRENRDRIVGFPGRYHLWDANKNKWSYDANVSCELSMVLTGGAFFHKYYSYLYSYLMPSVIRNMVDEFMNCEDIAMNVLVAHLTSKPPIKVTSRWTFRCPGCPTSLSSDDSHYVERTKCLNFFEKVYGYMPLKRTQFRADSVLFKTRLPLGKQKCYKFV